MSQKKLLISRRYSEDSVLLREAALDLGWSVDRVAHRLDGPTQADAVYGEVIWATLIAQQLGCKLTDPPDDWLARLPEDFTKRKVSFGAWGELKGSVTYPCFIKPPNWKSFKAGIYYRAHDTIAEIFDEAQVLISTQIRMLSEHRFWLLDGKVQTWGTYRGARLLDDDAAVAFVEKTYAALPLPRAVVIDIADMGYQQDVGYEPLAVVEANPAYCSGIYDADARKALEVIEKCLSPNVGGSRQ